MACSNDICINTILNQVGITMAKMTVARLEEKLKKEEERLKKYREKLSTWNEYNSSLNNTYKFKKKEFDKYLERTYPKICQYGAPTPKTGKRNLKTDAFSLAKFPMNDSIVKNRLDLTIFEKYRSTYIPMFKSSERIHPRYNILKSTGRTSSIIHLWPKEGGIREVIKADKGYKLLVIDYSALELCTFAETCYELLGFSKLGDWVNSGATPPDAHGLVTYALYSDDKGNPRVDFEEFVKWKKSDDKNKVDLYNKYRKPAKEVGLGYPGGRGHESIYEKMNLLGIEITKEEAIAQRVAQVRHMPEIVHMLGYRNIYPETFKGVKGWVSNQYVGSDKDGDLYAYESNGRYRVNCTFCACSNGKGMQSPASNGAAHAVSMVTRACYDPSLKSPLFGCKPCFFVHDELGIKIPDKDVDNLEVIEEANNLMIDAMQKITPHVRITTEWSVMENWTKDESEWLSSGKVWKDRLK